MPQTTITNERGTTTTLEKGKEVLLRLEVERNGIIKIKAKAHHSWEHWLSQVSELTRTTRLFSEGEGKFYKGQTNANCNFDDINAQIYNRGTFNFALLRVKDISSPQGVEFTINQLASKDEIEQAAKNLQETFKAFYFRNVKPCKVVATMYLEGY